MKGLKILFILFVAAGLALLLIIASRMLILEGKIPFPEAGRNLLVLVAPPKDYYKKLVLYDLPTDGSVGRFEVPLKHRYAATYEAGFLLKRGPTGPTKNLPEFRGRLRCLFVDQGAELFSISTRPGKSEGYIFGGVRFGDPGQVLFTYEAPRDVPLGKTLTLIVTVEESDSEYQNQYGPTRFFIERASVL